MANLIVGESQSGKTTLIKVLSKGKAHIKFSDYNICAVPKEDERLIELWKIFKSKSINFINLDFMDPPGNATFTSLNPQLYEKIQKAEIILYMLPLFREDKDLDEIKNQENEFILKDLETTEKLLKNRKLGIPEKAVLDKIQKSLLDEIPLSNMEFREDELKILSAWNLLSIKPIFYIINISNTQLEDEKLLNSIKEKLKDKIYFLFPAKLEEELLELDEKDVTEYLSMYNLSKSIRNLLIDKIFEFNNLISFFTVGEKDARAWKLKKGSTALNAAGVIHTDIAKGFIRAEVIRWDELVKIGDWKKAYQEGKVRVEKKDYIVEDGDVLYIRFHI
uniref:Redox-regulated ATPase YchF n=1 Tax=Dictyoglomus thermophilum TaxID=14 RepID=A0A7C3MIE3_DICTH